MIEIENVSYSYIKGKPVLDGLSFSMDSGLTVLYGGKGFGKSTICKIIAREIKCFGGEIKINGDAIKGKRAKELNISYITDDLMLRNNQTVRKNAEEALIVRNTPLYRIAKKADDALSVCDMAKYGDVLVKELSDCEKFYTALARSLAKSPDLIMIDDPFIRFEEGKRLEYTKKTKEVIKSLSTPVLYVTSDDFVANELNERTVVLSYGKVAYDGIFSDSPYANAVYSE